VTKPALPRSRYNFFMESTPSPPVVLALSGHDPSGGAGIQADIEAIQAQGCHPATVVTCLTVQDSSRVYAVQPVAPDLFLRQARCVLEDLEPAAIKIGLVPDPDLAAAIEALLREAEGIPVVLDPVLHAGGGGTLSAAETLAPLLPHCALATPNRREARLLGGAGEIDEAAWRILEQGCGAVLVTGADEAPADRVVNTLYRDAETLHWQWPRLAGSYHGSGCTLASAIAARLALGEPLVEAVERAQHYTLESLRRAITPGRGQALPRRILPAG